jgi:hypothetical protein
VIGGDQKEEAGEAEANGREIVSTSGPVDKKLETGEAERSRDFADRWSEAIYRCVGGLLLTNSDLGSQNRSFMNNKLPSTV